MLERKCYDIGNTLERGRAMWTRKPFCDHNPDTPMRFPSIPVTLLQDFLMELRKAQTIRVSSLINFWIERSALLPKRELSKHT